MNLPNKLTLLRLLLTPLVIILILVPLPVAELLRCFLAALLFALLAVTDTIDGHLARSRGLITDFGKLMDPIADKFLVLGSMAAVLIHEWPDKPFRNLFLAVLILVFLREATVTLARLYVKKHGGQVISAALPGKIKTVTQVICILILLLAGILPPLLRNLFRYAAVIVTGLVTVWSGLCFFHALSKPNRTK